MCSVGGRAFDCLRFLNQVSQRLHEVTVDRGCIWVAICATSGLGLRHAGLRLGIAYLGHPDFQLFLVQ